MGRIVFDMGAGYKFKPPLHFVDLLPYHKRHSLTEEIKLLEQQLELKKEHLHFIEMLTKDWLR